MVYVKYLAMNALYLVNNIFIMTVHCFSKHSRSVPVVFMTKSPWKE